MVHTITLREYEEYPCHVGEGALDPAELAGLEHFLNRKGLSKALTLTARGGIRARNYVGVIRYRKLQIQILPKLISEDDSEQANIIDNLIFMLSYTQKLDIRTSEANLYRKENPFPEILIREFAHSLFNCLKRWTPRTYELQEENIPALRGKLKFAENIRLNSANMARFCCEFDEFSEDNSLNRLFLFVSTCLYSLSRDARNKTILKQMMEYFADVTLMRFSEHDVARIHLTRMQELFRYPFMLARMFIERSSVDLSRNSLESVALLWDMNKLFEEFIYNMLRRNRPPEYEEIGVCAQKGKRLLKDASGHKRRNTFVDIMLEGKGKKIILDTKYKKMDSEHDVDNADLYQVVTYCLLHRCHAAALIYPCATTSDTRFCLNRDTSHDVSLPEYSIAILNADLRQKHLRDCIQQVAHRLWSQVGQLLARS